MANATCDKCGKKLHEICKTDKYILILLELLEKRIERVFLTNIVHKITPGIQHNEIISNDNCDGVLQYDHFDEEPETFNKFKVGDIMLGLISIDEARNIIYVENMKKK